MKLSKNKRKQLILDAAVDFVNQHGVKDLTIIKLAEVMKTHEYPCSLSTIRRFFYTLDDLLEAIEKRKVYNL